MTARQKMSYISNIIGVFSLIMIIFGFSIPFGAFGMIMALLSKGADRLDRIALRGLIMSLIGLIAGIAIAASSIIMIRSGAFNDIADQVIEQYGENMNDAESEEFRQMMNELFGLETTQE